VLGGALGEAERDEAVVQLRIPCPWSLAEPVQRLVEAQHLPLRSGLDESRGLRHVHLFLELSVEEGGLDVEMVHRPGLLRGDGEEEPDGIEPGDGGKDFLEVNSLSLHIALGDEAGLVPECLTMLPFSSLFTL
jgi:hypothetical protein